MPSIDYMARKSESGNYTLGKSKYRENGFGENDVGKTDSGKKYSGKWYFRKFAGRENGPEP